MLSQALVIAACSTSLMGCILRDFEYPPPPNVPASVHGSTDTPLAAVRLIDLDGPETEWRFVATVRDANLDQPLIGLLYVDRRPGVPGDLPYADIDIAPDDDDDRLSRRVEFVVPRTELSEPGCHWIELLVTSETTGRVDPQPKDPTDVGVGVWFVAATALSEGRDVITMDECATYGGDQ